MVFFKQVNEYLQGGVKFPTGGKGKQKAGFSLFCFPKVRERAGVDSVKFRNRQYSLDGRRYIVSAFTMP